jgi:hypothetical protein
MARGVTKMKAIQQALEDSSSFLTWKIEVEEMKRKSPNIEKRMSMALAGVHLGILPMTAVSLCGVYDLALETWLKSPENVDRMLAAISYAEARLEATVYQASLIDPYLAMSLLEKRNPKRWSQMEDRGNFNKSVEKGVQMSKLIGLSQKEEKIFDVATDVKVTRNNSKRQ